MPEALKRCTTCGEEKPVGGFPRDSSRPDGLRSNCKVCKTASDHACYLAHRTVRRANNKAYYEANKAAASAWQRQYREANRERLRALKCAYYQANKEKALAATRARYENKKAEVLAKNREWHLAHPEKTRAAANKYARRAVAELTDCYVRSALKMTAEESPAALVAAKRAQILVKRLLKEKA